MEAETKEHLGEVFKSLRTNRHISLKQLCDENVSVSQLSRFERGETDLSLARFLTALDHMGVEVGEYMDAVRGYQKTEQIALMSSLVELEYKRDIAGFRKLYEEQEAKFKEHPDVYRYRLNVIMLQSFICKCDPEIPFPGEMLDEVTDYLFTTEEWNMYELILIGNLYLFIDIPVLHRMGQEIVKRKKFYSQIGSRHGLMIVTLLNIWETCLHRDSIEIARYYSEAIHPLLDNETDLYHRTIYLFLLGLQHYKEGSVLSGIDEMKKAIGVFDAVGSKHLANNYRKDLKRFVH